VADAFVSYSHRDEAFVAELVAALKSRGKQTWVDHEDIVPAAQWSQEIEKGITESDAFIFVISPDSVASSECLVELEHAVVLPKRIVPVVARETPDAEVPDELRSLHWLQFPGQEFASTVDRLVEVLDTDIEHLHLHTKLLVRAGEWEARGHDRSALLRGRDLDEAEQWQAEQTDRKPEPTPGQLQLILASRKAAVRRQRTSVLVGVIAVVVLAGLSAYALVQQHAAVIQRDTAQSRYLASQAQSQLQSDPQLSLILALRAYDTAPTTQAEAAVRSATAASDVRAILPGADQATGSAVRIMTADAFDPTGRWLVSFNRLGTVEVWKWGASAGRGSDADPYLLHLHGLRALKLSSYDPQAHPTVLSDVQFTADGSRVLIGAADGHILTWNWQHSKTATVVGTVHLDPIFNPGSTDVASDDTHDDRVVVLPVVGGPVISQFPLDGNGYGRIAFSRSGRLLAYEATLSTVEIRDVASGALVRSVPVSLDPTEISEQGPFAFSPNDKRVAIAEDDDDVKIVYLDDPSVAPVTLPTPPPPGISLALGNVVIMLFLAWSPNGDELAASGNDSARVWWVGGSSTDTKPVFLSSGSTHYSGPFSLAGPETAGIAFSPDGSRVATSSLSGTEQVWDWDSADSPVLRTAAGAVAIDPKPTAGHRIVALADDDGQVILWDWQDHTTTTLMDPQAAVRGSPSVAFSPNGAYLASTGYHQGLYGIDINAVSTGRLLAWLPLSANPALDVSSQVAVGFGDGAFTNDGRTLYFGVQGPGGSVYFASWTWQDATPLQLVQVAKTGFHFGQLFTETLTPVAVRGDYFYFIVGSTLFRWDGSSQSQPVAVSDRAIPPKATYGKQVIYDSEFAEATQTLLETTNSEIAVLVDFHTGAVRRVLTDFQSVAFTTNPNVSFVVTSSFGGLLVVWDYQTSDPPAVLTTLLTNQNEQPSLDVSADGTYFVEADAAGVQVFPSVSYGPFPEVLKLALRLSHP